jgi:acid stress chaperone HdeB
MSGRVIIWSLLALAMMSSAQGQMSIDISKVTCDQFVHEKIGPSRTTAAWFSGFYHGKQDKQIIDMSTLETNLSKLERFCYEEKNFNVPVLRAIDTIASDR